MELRQGSLSAAGIIGSFGLRRSIGAEDEQDRDWAWLAAPRLTMPQQTTLVPPAHIQAVEPATKKKTIEGNPLRQRSYDLRGPIVATILFAA
jgi:hypothetical protein